MKKIIILGIMIFTLCSCSNSSSDNETKEFNFGFENEVINLQTGDVHTLALNIENAENVFLLSFEINYNTDIIEFEQDSFSIGEFWIGDTINFCKVDEEGLSVIIGLTQNNEVQGLSGEGEVMSIALAGLTPGNSDIVINNFCILDESGNQINPDIDIPGCTVLVD